MCEGTEVSRKFIHFYCRCRKSQFHDLAEGYTEEVLGALHLRRVLIQSRFGVKLLRAIGGRFLICFVDLTAQ